MGLTLLPCAGLAAPMLNTRVQSVEDTFTGVGQGDPILDTAAFRALAARGRPFYARGDYQIARRIHLATGAQVIGLGSRKARLVAKTGPGQLDRDRATGGVGGEDNTMFHADGAEGIAFENLLFEMEWHDDIRTVRPIVLDRCVGARIESCDITGFKDPHGGLVTLDRSDRFVIRNLRGFEIFSDSVDPDRLPAQQISLIEFDNNSGTTPSLSFEIDGVQGWSITQGPASSSHYGYQTDLVNGQGRGHTGGIIRNLHAVGLGEVLDFWGSGARIDRVEAKDTIGSVLKFVYGASRNIVRNVASDGCGLSQILVATSNNPLAKDAPTGNRFEGLKLMNSGSGWRRHWGSKNGPAVSPQAAISLETAAGNPEHGPADNHFSGVVHAQDAASCPVLVMANRTGPRNTFAGDLLVPAGGRAIAILHDDAHAPGLTVRLASPIKLNLTPAPREGDTALVAREDLRRQWNSESQTFTPLVPGSFRIHGALYPPRKAAWPDGIRLRLWEGGVLVASLSPVREDTGRQRLAIDVQHHLDSNSVPTDSGSAPDTLRFEWTGVLDNDLSRITIEIEAD